MGIKNNEILKDWLNLLQEESSDKSVDIAETLKKQEYYHITNLEYLKDFSNGAMSDVSDWEWQWLWFYMWTDNKRADKHVDFQKAYRYFVNERRFKVWWDDLVIKDEQPFITKQMPPVKLTFDVNPDECEPDWETCWGTWEVFNFLCEYENILKWIPVWECKINGKEENILAFDKTKVYKDFKNIKIPYVDWSYWIEIWIWGLNTCDAAWLAYIMHYFRDNYPKLYKIFVSSIQPSAVKYIWKKPIFPSKVELLKDGCREEIDAEEYFKSKKVKYTWKKWNKL